jgi:uncharacterized membrane protein (DUF373 family)
MSTEKERSRERRERVAELFRQIEYFFYIAIAVALALSGVALFGSGIYNLVADLDEEPFASQLLGFLDAMLLVFIVTELIHTVSAILRENILMTEPFLIVGIVAAIRRLVVISAEIQDLVGKPEFSDALMEMGVLVLIVVGLALSIFLLRHTEHSEPRPSYEPQP